MIFISSLCKNVFNTALNRWRQVPQEQPVLYYVSAHKITEPGRLLQSSSKLEKPLVGLEQCTCIKRQLISAFLLQKWPFLYHKHCVSPSKSWKCNIICSSRVCNSFWEDPPPGCSWRSRKGAENQERKIAGPVADVWLYSRGLWWASTAPSAGKRNGSQGLLLGTWNRQQDSS